MQVDAAYLPHTVFQNALTMNTSFSPSSSLVQDLLGQLQGAPLQQMSEQLGIGGTQLQSAVGQALPLLLGALGNNATPQGAADLLGSVLQGGGGGLGNLLGGLLGGGAAPQSADVLGSLLGNARARVEGQLAQTTGLGDKVVPLLTMLAPLVLQFLSQRAGAQDGAPALDSMGGGVLGNLLDQNGDGKLDASDLFKLGASFLGGRK